jgi:SAM-dependent methyltransferase
LNAGSHVVEVAANDGYLLQYVKARGIPCTGIEPTASTAAAARAKGIRIVEAFFGAGLAQQFVQRGEQADLTFANNVLAHVPDINDFVSGFSGILAPQGVATFEFPHLYNLVAHNQFDTIYHEHFSYLSLTAVERIFAANGLTVFDVEELSTHGGSLRVFAQRSDTGLHQKTERLDALRKKELDACMTTASYYLGFQASANKVKDHLMYFLLDAKRTGRSVGAYGAAAKGNTLLNYAGVRTDLLGYVVDKNPAKQGKFLPGSRIPIVAEEHLRNDRPQFVLILPWNLQAEIREQLAYISEWGGRFVTAVPLLEIH